MIPSTRKSGNIVVQGKTLTPADYRLVAPFLGRSLKQRIRLATGIASQTAYVHQLNTRQTLPLAYFILNTPCNRKCDFCFFEPEEKTTTDIDWHNVGQRIDQAKAKGFQTKVYPKEINRDQTIFWHALQLMDKAGETFAITNGENPFSQQQLMALARSSIGHVVVSFLPRTKAIEHYDKDSFEQTCSTINGLVLFSRGQAIRPFTVGLFCQIDPNEPQNIDEVTRAAIAFGVDAVNFRLTRKLGQGRERFSLLSYNEIDAFLLAFIETRIKYPRDKIQLLLSSAMFGPNYYSGGMFRYQLGLDQDPYFSSKYPCPMLDSKGSYSVLLPSERQVLCPTLAAEKLTNTAINDHLAHPSAICQPCDALIICRGGCVASRLQGQPLADIKNTNLDICLTEVFRRWETSIT